MAEEAQEEAQAAPAGGKKKVIIIGVVAAVLVIGAAVGISLFLLGGKDAEGESAEAEPEVQVESTYIEITPEFVINFQDRNGRAKFMKVEMSVSTRDEAVPDAVARHLPAIRNNLVLLLSRQVYDDLLTNEGKEALRQQALAEVQKVLEGQIGKTGVEELYFSSFVMH